MTLSALPRCSIWQITDTSTDPMLPAFPLREHSFAQAHLYTTTNAASKLPKGFEPTRKHCFEVMHSLAVFVVHTCMHVCNIKLWHISATGMSILPPFHNIAKLLFANSRTVTIYWCLLSCMNVGPQLAAGVASLRTPWLLCGVSPARFSGTRSHILGMYYLQQIGQHFTNTHRLFNVLQL